MHPKTSKRQSGEYCKGAAGRAKPGKISGRKQGGRREIAILPGWKLAAFAKACQDLEMQTERKCLNVFCFFLKKDGRT